MNKKISSTAIFIAASLLVSLLTGCRIYTEDVTSDTLWMNGQMTTLINRQYRDRSLGSHSLGGGYDPVVKNDWILVKPTFSGQIHRYTRIKFSSVDGGSFLLINGSDLLIHRFSAMPGKIGGHFALFDPKAGKDISALFSSNSAATVFNRSRTKCLTLVDGKAMILDVLAATNSSLNTLPRPSWTVPLLRLKKGGMFVHLSEDTSCLFSVSRGYPSPPSEIQAWSTNQDLQYFTIPIKEKGSEIIDADSVNGEVLFLARLLLPGGSRDSLKILNKDGDAEYSTNISAMPTDIHWDPPRHEILIGTDELWNY